MFIIRTENLTKKYKECLLKVLLQKSENVFTFWSVSKDMLNEFRRLKVGLFLVKKILDCIKEGSFNISKGRIGFVTHPLKGPFKVINLI